MTANDKRIAGLHEGPQGVRTSDYHKIVLEEFKSKN